MRWWSHHLLSVLFLGYVFLSAATALDSNKKKCTGTQFQCANGRCISVAWLCDGDDDCHDKSDELNCTSTTCGETDFKCVENGACIPERWKCDKEPDCKEGSDENRENCAEASSCKEDQFQCGSKCIQNIWLCDGDEDCDNGEDEDPKVCTSELGKSTCKPETEFQCKTNSQCITARWKCDKNEDCSDGSDEVDCPEDHSDCADYEFKCVSDGHCIQENWHCDGDKDCSDGSDEEVNCTSTKKECRKSEFQCKSLDRLCIHISWVCDGDFDCEDHSDEHCNITCASDQFLCEENYCIHQSLKCDGQADCIDGSDELNCPPDTPVCKNNTFDCHGNGLKCIPFNLVCDNWNDCGNNEDERTESHDPCPEKDPCEDNNGGCQQICYRSPDGPICDCHSGFKLVGGSPTECEDVDECQTPGTCSQTCINLKGGFKCECHKGYELMHHTCKALEGEPELLLADRKDLRRYNLHTKKYTLLVDSTVEGAVAMDFHFGRNFVFWTDGRKEQIEMVNLLSGESSVVVAEDVQTPDGLAVDWVHDKLYWTDTGRDHIEVANFDGSMRRVLISDGLDEPRAIAVHPGKKLMFWTDWGWEPKIESCGMNGKHRKTIIIQQIVWPNGLTIDYVDDRLYWIDAKTHIIGSADLDGQNQRVILRGHQHLGHPFSVTVFEDYVYWSDWPSESIRRYNKFKKGEVETIAQMLDTPMDIRILHPYRQQKYDNLCGANNGGCQQLCLPDPEVDFTCECQNGFVPDANDSKKCVEGVPPPTTAAPASSPKPPVTQTPHPNSTPAKVTKPTVPQTSAPTPSPTPTTPTPTPTPTSTVNQTSSMPVSKEAEEGLGHIAVIVIAIVLLIALLVILVSVLVFRRYRKRNIKSMNFDNPVYRKTTTEDKVYMDKTGSQQHLPSCVQPLNTDAEIA